MPETTHVVNGINHYVVDTDKHYVIDPTSRKIENDGLNKINLIQYDHNSEVLSFEIDKMIEGHDMSLCNVVEIHFINVNATTRETNKGVYEVKDFATYLSDNGKLLFTWPISDEATIHPGPLSFLIMFACVENGLTTYRWNTDTNSTMSVLTGMNNGNAVIDNFPDILTQWRNELFSKNYAYEGAVLNGFKGTEEEWYEILQKQAHNSYLWEVKQDNIDWITEEDIDKMFEGTYTSTEDEIVGTKYIMIPSDYAQNDPTKGDYILNRPFYQDGDVIVPIEDKFIPDTIVRTSDLAKLFVRTVVIELSASKWVDYDNGCYQVVSIDDITPYSKIDLQPTAEQLTVFYEKDISFVTENDNGTVTVFCIGQAPANDYIMQATITEVVK